MLNSHLPIRRGGVLMKLFKMVAVCVALVAPLALAKDKKKSGLPTIFSNARYVYVQAEDGDIMKPGLVPEDREAIADVQDAVKSWNRYAVTLNRRDADLIFIVRKGRLASVQLNGGIGVGATPGISGSYPSRNTAGTGNANPDRNGTVESVGARSEVGPNDDILRVYSLSPQGSLLGPFWSNEMKDGLDAPDVPLLRTLKEAVEHAYPPQPAGQPAGQPTNPPRNQPVTPPAAQNRP
jgi:hypothetical protein